MPCEILFVKVKSKSSKNSIDKDADGNVIISVRSPRDKGQANMELIETLAEYYAVPKSNVQILSGFKSTKKKVRIDSYE